MWHCSKVASPDISDRCEILNQSVKQIKKSDSHLTDVPRATKMMIVKTMQNCARARDSTVKAHGLMPYGAPHE